MNKYSIKIYPSGSGRVTNRALVDELKKITPETLREAERLLAVTAKYVKKSGLFSSETSRLLNIQNQYYKFHKTLIKEKNIKISPILIGSDEDLKEVFEYLSLVSDMYPNWQKEYEVLNRFIPMF